MIKRLICIVLIICIIASVNGFAYAQSENEAQKASFSDLSENDWYYKYVNELSRGSIIKGYPDGTFRPEEKVTWGEALKLITYAAGYGEQIITGTHWRADILTLL